jgi:hypothetical protein
MSNRLVVSVLYELGFNVIPVDADKKPIGSWSSDRRLPWDELEKRLAKASGVAITGRYLEDGNYGIAVLDLDDVDAAVEILRQVFGEDWAARLCGQAWSFCGLTGPRPKGRVNCDCKAPGEDCDCVIQDTGERKKLSELQRGMYIVVRVPKRCLLSGTVRSSAIEVMVTNYEVVYGRHPSGAFYQPVVYEDGRWKPISIEDVGQGEVITCDELKALIALIKQSTTNTLEELGKEDAKTAIELNLPEPARELSEESINQIVNSVRPLWWLETDEGKHIHDYLLYGLSSLLRRGGIKYEIARKVVEAIINAGLQDIAGKVDPNTLQRIMRNEERHFRETVDYVYTKPTAKLWGRKTFEEVLKPAIERAIEQGLLSGVSKPEEWFQAIYNAIYGGQREKVGVDWGVLDEYLPPTKSEPTNLPAWAGKLRIGDIEYCLSTPLCTKAIITHTREDSQYVLLAVREVITKEDENGNKREVHNYSPIALLPKYMGEVRDPFYDEWFYIALHDGKVLAVSSEFDDFIRAITNMPGGGYYVIRNTQYLNVINAFLPRVEQVISAGITDDSFVDPYGVLDVNDYGIEPLLKAYEWVRKYYPETNAGWAWFNVMAAFAKVLTPLVRYRNRTFNDMIVYNVGRGGEGKSTLVRYILMQLLGGEDAKEQYFIAIDGAVRTEPQLRNLLSLNRLPLILDEQNRKALAANVGIFLSATVGLSTTGVQAARYGHGIAVKFKNLRGMVVFTNVPFVSFLRDIVSEASDYAIIRRFVEIAWDTEPINPAAFKDLPELKPIYGFATRLWQKYRDELIKSADLLELIEKLAIAIGREYLGDPKVSEMVEYTLEIIKELRETKRNERLALTDVDALLNRAYEFVANELKTPQLTAVKVLRYILENPQRASIKLTRPKNSEELEKQKRGLDEVIHKYLMYRYGIEDTSDRGITGKDPDAVTLYTLLKNAYDEEKVTAILFAKSPLIPGTPKEFLGAPKNAYAEGGVKKFGYAIPLAKLVRIFLAGEEESENESNGKTTEEPSSNGEAPWVLTFV